jgi:uncharacterized spore protein YtfJ
MTEAQAKLSRKLQQAVTEIIREVESMKHKKQDLYHG